MFLLRNKKDISIFRMKKAPYLLLWILWWASPWENVSLGICGQQRPWSSCASTQSAQSLRCLPTESLDTIECVSEKQIPGWDFEHVQNESEPGPSCSKLTISLVNDSLKFTSSIRKYADIFCWKNVSSFCSAKATHIFSAKNIRILYIESAKTVYEMTLNELVKLTTLWTTGPSAFCACSKTPIHLVRPR